MNFAFIQSSSQQPIAAPPSPQAAATVARVLEQVRQAAYKKEEYTKAPEVMAPALPSTTVVHHSQNYCQSKGWARVAGMFEAMDRREKGERVLSYREADIAARHNLLDVKIVVDQLMSPYGFCITEDIAGVDCSVYECRRRYNALVKDWKKGLQYKATLYDKQPLEQKTKCDTYMLKLETEMKAIRNHFAGLGLAMWPEELEHGFHPNLCRPEFMTEEQYLEKVAKFETNLHDWKDPNETT